MSRYRRQLTRPEIARLADETTELRRELQDLVTQGKRKTPRVVPGSGPAKAVSADSSPAGAILPGSRKRRHTGR